MPDEPGKPPSDPPQGSATSEGSGGGLLGQDEIEALLNQTQDAVDSLAEAEAPPAQAPPPAAPPAVAPPVATSPPVDQPAAQPFVLEDLKPEGVSESVSSLDMLRDVELNLQIELGRTQMFVEDVLRLRRGSVVALEKLAGDPVDVYANGHLIARGEVLVLNENFCVRITEIVSPAAKLAAG